MQTIHIQALAALLFIVPAAAQSSLIGKEIPPIPNNCQRGESGVLGPSDKFAYSFLLCESEYVVLLERFSDRRGKKAYWIVLDEIRVPNDGSGQQPLSVLYCQSTEYKGEYVFAVGSWKESANSYEAIDISRAWRFNLEKSKIELIGNEGISCTMDKID